MTNFLLGFLSSSCLFMAMILAYYIRARRRVKSIQAAIEQYQRAQAEVTHACDKVYGCKCGKSAPKN